MRDVSTLVKPAQVIDTEHLTTLFVIISKFSVKDWEEGYEKMCNFVVSAWAVGSERGGCCEAWRVARAGVASAWAHTRH